MKFYFFLLLFRVLLDISYVTFVNPIFEYSGFTLDVYLKYYAISWFFYIATLPALKTRIKLVSDYFFMAFVLFVIAPLTSVYGLNNWSLEPVIVSLASFFLFVFITRSKIVKTPAIPTVQYGRSIAIGVSVILVAFLLVWYPVSGASFNLDLTKVYEFRMENSELASQGVLAYLNNWIYKIFSIFALGYFIYKRSWLGVVFIVAAQIVFYGYSAHKSVLFGLLLVFGTWFWFRRSDKAYIVPLGLCVCLSISLFAYFLLNDILTGSMFIRRVFYVPAYLTFKYFEFFNENPHVFWSNSFLSGFIDYPYDLTVPLTIGSYIGQPTASANNGFVSMGFAHMGYLGVLIYTSLFAYILRVFDIVTKRIGSLWLSLAITITPLRAALISSDLLTTLLTHGLIISILLVLLMRSKESAYS